MKQKNKLRIKCGAFDGLHSIFYHLDALQSWEKRETFPPLYVELSPTDMCNQQCFYCYVDHLQRMNTHMPRELLLRTMQELGSFGVKACEFQGTGEPLLNPATPDAIVAGREAGMDMCLVTNAVQLNNEIAEKIVPHLSFLRISSFAHSQEMYTRLHGGAYSQYDQVIKNLKDAITIRDRDKLPLVIVATFIVFDFNAPFIYETAKMLKEMGVNIFKAWPLVSLADQNMINVDAEPVFKKHEELFKKTKQLEDEDFKVFLNIKNLMTFNGARDEMRSYDQCHGVYFETHIDPRGRIYPCQRFWQDESFCLGDLKRNSFQEIWESNTCRDVLMRFVSGLDLQACEKFCCKQHSINGYLSELANPPRHVNVI